MNKIVKGATVIGGGVAAGIILASLTAKAEPTEYTFELSGVNYISLPMIPEDATPVAVFGVGIPVVTYDSSIPSGWYVPSFLECGKGYSVYTPEPKTVTITGSKCVVTRNDLIDAYNSLTGTPYEGSLWMLVGAGTKSINVSGSILEGLIEEYIRETSEWEYTNILEPMKGYWMEKPVTV